MLACTARAEAVLRPRRPAVRFNSASTAALLTPDSVPRIDWAGSACCVPGGGHGSVCRWLACCRMCIRMTEIGLAGDHACMAMVTLERMAHEVFQDLLLLFSQKAPGRDAGECFLASHNLSLGRLAQ